MKIGFVLDDTLDSTDGIQQYVVCVGEWLRARGHDVQYFVGETTRSDLVGMHSLTKNVVVRFNGNRLSMPLPVSTAHLRRLLVASEVEVLHVQVPYSPYLGGRLVRAASAQVAVVGTFHILPYGVLARMGSDILGKINASTAQRFDAMMATSVPSQQCAGQRYGFRSVVVANPFHHDLFSVARRGKKAARPVKRIVFLGRLVRRKGARQLLEAVAHIQKECIKTEAFEVIIAGKGPERTGLERFVRDHDIADMVSFPGFIDEGDKPALLASADIAVFPSTAGESFGISLLEAMAACPGVVLAGNNPGYASVVASPQQLVQPMRTAEFAEALAQWLADDTGRTQMAHVQQAHVQQFDIDVIGPHIEKIYQTALQTRKNM